MQNFQIADKCPAGGYSGHQKLPRASQAHLQHGRSTAPGRKAEGNGLVYEHKERTALAANQIIMAAFGHFLCCLSQYKHSKPQSKGVSHLYEHPPNFPSQFPAFQALLNCPWPEVTGCGSLQSLFLPFPNIARGDMRVTRDVLSTSFLLC